MSASTIAQRVTTRSGPGTKAVKALEEITGDSTPIVLALLLVAPVVAAAVFYVWTHVATVRLGYELANAARVHAALVEENRGLRIEVAALKRPDRLKRLAARNYQLRAPSPGQIIRMGDR